MEAVFAPGNRAELQDEAAPSWACSGASGSAGEGLENAKMYCTALRCQRPRESGDGACETR